MQDDDALSYQGTKERPSNPFRAARAYLKQAFTHGAGVGQTQIWTMFQHALRNRSEARSDTGRPFKHVGPHVSAVKLYAIRHHSNINMHVNFIAIVQSFLWSMGLHWPKLDADLTVAGLLAGIFGSRMWMRELASTGGKAVSERKAAAARANGAKGGRPRLVPEV